MIKKTKLIIFLILFFTITLKVSPQVSTNTTSKVSTYKTKEEKNFPKNNNSKLEYLILDNTLYYVDNNETQTMLKNIIDFNYLDENNVILFQKEQNSINIYILSKTTYNKSIINLFPFLKDSKITKEVKKLYTINLEKNEYVGNIIKKDEKSNISKILVLLSNLITEIELKGKNIVNIKKLVLNQLSIDYLSPTFLTLQKENEYYIYDPENLKKPLLNLNNTKIIQVSKINSSLIFLCLENNNLPKISKKEDYLVLKLVENNKIENLYYEPTKVSYDSLYYIFPLNDDMIGLQINSNLKIFKLIKPNSNPNSDNNSKIKKIIELKSYYSYFENNYLFTLNMDNLSIFTLKEDNLEPLFSIPNINYFYFKDQVLFYTLYDKDYNIWKLYSILLLPDKDLSKENVLIEKEELTLYTLPEKIILL